MHTKRIAVSRNLNTYELYTRPGEPRFDMEDDYFQAHDRAAAAVHRALIGDAGVDTLGVDERRVWARFVLGLLHRSPEALASLTDFIEMIFPEVRGDLVRKISQRDPRPYSEIDLEFAWLSELRDQYASYTRQSFLVQQIEEPRHLEALCRREWHIVRDSTSSLPTSDRPVVIYGTVVVMALNPTCLLVMTPSSSQFTQTEAEILVRTHLASLVLVGARSLVLAAPPAAEQVEEIAAALALRARAGEAL